ncbi:MAG TPA: winged helix-turn-helix domain-containing protein, partial [Terriglobia bacterium]|nr:winged helix-turn-helix domain-containing protein [Terriglobia bacterium]
MVAVDRKAAIPLHRQIYDGLRAAIVRRDLRPGQRVPSSRDLASELGVSRIPVLNAYAQLLAEGYLESRVGAGTFVSGSMPDRLTVCELHAPQPGQAIQGDKSGLSGFGQSGSGPRLISRRSRLLPPFERKPWVRGWGAFGVHQPAFDQFPFETWSRLVLRHSRSPRAHALQRIHPL